MTRRHALLSALACLAAPVFPEPPALMTVLTRDGWTSGYVDGAGMLVVVR
jgi:hypothetical protein